MFFTPHLRNYSRPSMEKCIMHNHNSSSSLPLICHNPKAQYHRNLFCWQSHYVQKEASHV